MNALTSLTAQFEAHLQQCSFPASPQNLYDPLRYFMTLGGKRIRPVLTLMGASLFGAEAHTAFPAATAVEYFHNFSLIHDDIMDEAPLRRAKPTVHTRWNLHIGILSGDVLLVKAYEQLCMQHPGHIPALLAVFNRTAIEVCEGQQMDMDFEQRDDVSIAAYTEMIRLKTSVLLGAALELGAITADASETDRQLLYTYGVKLGIAFQIQDDLLDLYADPDKFGKQVGGDMLANKKTILLLIALDLADDHDKKAIHEAMAATDPAQKLEQIRLIFDRLQVREAVLQLRDSYFTGALEALEQIQVSDEARKPLRDMLEFLREREL